MTYKHLSAVAYALSIFSGTKLYGRELVLKNRSSNSNRNSLSNQQQNSPYQQQQPISNSLTQSYHANPLLSAINCSNDMMPINMQFASSDPQQQLLQQQQMLQLQEFAIQLYRQSNGGEAFQSTRSDNIGSQRDHDFVDRNRNRHQRDDDDRNSRNKPYRRSRTRSPAAQHRGRGGNVRDHSPVSSRNQHRDRNRRGNKEGGYHRWNLNHRK